MNFYRELRINTTGSINKGYFTKIRYTHLILQYLPQCSKINNELYK